MADAPIQILRDAQSYWMRTQAPGDERRFAHWREGLGEKRWKTIGDEIDAHLDYLAVLSSCDYSEFTSACDWGVGGGAHAARILQRIPVLHGVDISKPTLDECVRQVRNAGVPVGHCFSPVLIDISRPAEVTAIGQVDLFTSCAAFQHFPGVWYADAVVKVAGQILKPGRPGLIQIREDTGTPYHRTKKGKYLKNKNAIRFCSHTEKDFSAMLAASDLEVLGTARARASYLYFYIRKES